MFRFNSVEAQNQTVGLQPPVTPFESSINGDEIQNESVIGTQLLYTLTPTKYPTKADIFWKPIEISSNLVLCKINSSIQFQEFLFRCLMNQLEVPDNQRNMKLYLLTVQERYKGYWRSRRPRLKQS